MLEHRNLVLEQCKVVFVLKSVTKYTCKMNAITLQIRCKLIVYLQSVNINLQSSLLYFPYIYKTTILLFQQILSYLPSMKDILNLSSTLQSVHDLIISSNHFSVFKFIVYLITLEIHPFLINIKVKHSIFIGIQ